MTDDQQHSEFALLDCTLRDGGYYTDWDFADRVVRTYLESMARLPIDTVELGYCNPPRTGYYGKYFFLTPEITSWARSLLAPTQSLGVMLDEKSIDVDSARRALEPHRGIVDLVRIAVPPTRLANAVALGAMLREMGFKVGVNVMYLSQYWEDPLALAAFDQLPAVCDAVSLVDSYGACSPGDVEHAIARVVEAHPGLSVGFHGHDNLGLALANSLAAVRAGAAIVDATVMGMGRGPGNTRTEQIVFQSQPNAVFQLDHLALGRVLDEFVELHKKYQWGTNLVYMVSGAAGLPQNKVMDWLGKNRYSVAAIIHSLQGELVDELDTSRYEQLRGSSADVLLVGGGASVDEHRSAVLRYVGQSGTTVVHANYRHLDLIGEIVADQYVCLAGDVVDRLVGPELLEKTTALIVPAGRGSGCSIRAMRIALARSCRSASRETQRPSGPSATSDPSPWDSGPRWRWAPARSP